MQSTSPAAPRRRSHRLHGRRQLLLPRRRYYTSAASPVARWCTPAKAGVVGILLLLEGAEAGEDRVEDDEEDNHAENDDRLPEHRAARPVTELSPCFARSSKANLHVFIIYRSNGPGDYD